MNNQNKAKMLLLLGSLLVSSALCTSPKETSAITLNTAGSTNIATGLQKINAAATSIKKTAWNHKKKLIALGLLAAISLYTYYHYQAGAFASPDKPISDWEVTEAMKNFCLDYSPKNATGINPYLEWERTATECIEKGACEFTQEHTDQLNCVIEKVGYKGEWFTFLKDHFKPGLQSIIRIFNAKFPASPKTALVLKRTDLIDINSSSYPNLTLIDMVRSFFQKCDEMGQEAIAQLKAGCGPFLSQHASPFRAFYNNPCFHVRWQNQEMCELCHSTPYVNCP